MEKATAVSEMSESLTTCAGGAPWWWLLSVDKISVKEQTGF